MLVTTQITLALQLSLRRQAEAAQHPPSRSRMRDELARKKLAIRGPQMSTGWCATENKCRKK